MEVNEEDTCFCIFCCYYFSSSSQQRWRRKGGGDGEELGVGGSQSQSSVGGTPGMSSQQLSKEFKYFLEELEVNEDVVSLMKNSVCFHCCGVIENIVKLKGETEEAEGEVIRLQKQVLEAMKGLDNCLDKFHNELKWMGTTVKNGDLECLEELVREGRVSKEVIYLRARIEQVVEDLTVFRKDLDIKINCPPPPRPPIALKSIRTRAKGSSSRRSRAAHFSQVNIGSGTVQEGPSLTTIKTEADELFHHDQVFLVGIHDDGFDDFGETPSPTPIDLVNDTTTELQDDLSLLSPTDPITAKSANSPANTKRQLLQRNRKNIIRRKQKRKSPARRTKTNNDKLSSLPSTSDPDGIASDGENAKYLQLPTSPWKQQVINNLLKADESYRRRLQGQDEHEDSQMIMEYFNDNDKEDLTFGGVSIVFLEKDSCLGCSLCKYRTPKNESSFYLSIKRHVERHHGNCVCDGCGAWFRNLAKFRAHIKSCNKGPAPSEEPEEEGPEEDNDQRRTRKRRQVIYQETGNHDNDEDEMEEEPVKRKSGLLQYVGQLDKDDDWSPDPNDHGDKDCLQKNYKRRNDRLGKRKCPLKKPSIHLQLSATERQQMPRWNLEILRRIDRWKDGREAQQMFEMTRDLPGDNHDIIVDSYSSGADLLRYDHQSELLTFYDIPVILNPKDHVLQCSKCDYVTTPSTRSRDVDIHRYMTSHIVTNHLGPFYCTQCDANFQNPRALKQHLETHSGGGIFCDICLKPLSSSKALGFHKTTHMSSEEKALLKITPRPSSSKSYPCSTCGRSCSSKSMLISHEQTHLEPEQRDKIVCPHCGKVLTRMSSLDTHLRYTCAQAGMLAPRLKCLHCDASLKNEKELRKHIERNHSSTCEKNFQCEQCERAFRYRGELNRHVRDIHYDEHQEDLKNWTCEDCGKVFYVRRYWKRHGCKMKKRGRCQDQYQDESHQQKMEMDFKFEDNFQLRIEV